MQVLFKKTSPAAATALAATAPAAATAPQKLLQLLLLLLACECLLLTAACGGLAATVPTAIFLRILPTSAPIACSRIGGGRCDLYRGRPDTRVFVGFLDF